MQNQTPVRGILAPQSEKNLVMKTMRTWVGLFLTFFSILFANQAGMSAENESYSMPLKTVPTFSTENIAREGPFYVGGKWVGEPGKQRMRGAMYVEVWVPKKIRHPYPILFVQAGGGQTSVGLLQTPDGRPGWAYDSVNQGYTIYMMDFPGRGRSAFIPGLDGEGIRPRPGECV